MRVAILPSADRDLDDIYDWIAEDDPGATARHVRRLTVAALNLRDVPLRGMARQILRRDADEALLPERRWAAVNPWDAPKDGKQWVAGLEARWGRRK